VVDDRSGRVAHVQQHVEQARVAPFRADAPLQLDHVAERCQRPVHQPHHVSQNDLAGRSAQPVAALAPALADHQPCVLQKHQDRFQELLRDLLVGRHAPDLDDAAALVRLRQVQQRLQRVQAAPRELHISRSTL
jgi:hypothetical protein